MRTPRPSPLASLASLSAPLKSPATTRAAAHPGCRCVPLFLHPILPRRGPREAERHTRARHAPILDADSPAASSVLKHHAPSRDPTRLYGPRGTG
eukprot:scaffold34111_cov112-Isochrysis_galbana.AAC.1